tara:strand:- start:1365 stop:1808 length:444 start_codon:yes stop_codon:yes gene_type:complete
MKMRWTKKLHHYAYLLMMSILLTSCSAQWHLKKAVQKDPTVLQRDTLTVMDTVVSPPVAITDTVIMKQHDTITLVKDRLRVSIIKVNDTITIDAICDSDTIVSVIEIPYEKIVYVEKESFWDKFKDIILMIGVLLVCFKIAGKWFRS